MFNDDLCEWRRPLTLQSMLLGEDTQGIQCLLKELIKAKLEIAMLKELYQSSIFNPAQKRSTLAGVNKIVNSQALCRQIYSS